MNIKHIKDIKDTLIYKNSAVESQQKEYLNKDLFSSAREINKRIEKEEMNIKTKSFIKYFEHIAQTKEQKRKETIKTIQETTFVVCLFTAFYFLLLLGSI
jgi:ferric iron reductase protein FhuF